MGYSGSYELDHHFGLEGNGDDAVACRAAHSVPLTRHERETGQCEMTGEMRDEMLHWGPLSKDCLEAKSWQSAHQQDRSGLCGIAWCPLETTVEAVFL